MAHVLRELKFRCPPNFLFIIINQCVYWLVCGVILPPQRRAWLRTAGHSTYKSHQREPSSLTSPLRAAWTTGLRTASRSCGLRAHHRAVWDNGWQHAPGGGRCSLDLLKTPQHAAAVAVSSVSQRWFVSSSLHFTGSSLLIYHVSWNYLSFVLVCIEML